MKGARMMIDISTHNLLLSNRETLKECSFDETNNIYMTESKKIAVNFDKVKRKYLNNMSLSEENATSVDAIIQNNENDIFIEFKNGKMKGEKRNVKDKIRDSLLILFDLTKENISYSRKNIIFILVYNQSKNPLDSRQKINQHFSSKAGAEVIRFDLEKYQTLFFKEVHTYTEKEFEKYIENIV